MFIEMGTIALRTRLATCLTMLADLVLWDADETRTIRDEDMFSGARFSICSGWEVTGWPTMTIRRGEAVFKDGKIRAEAGTGHLLRRNRWSGF